MAIPESITVSLCICEWFGHTLLLRGDMKGESGCTSAFMAALYAAHVENISCSIAVQLKGL